MNTNDHNVRSNDAFTTEPSNHDYNNEMIFVNRFAVNLCFYPVLCILIKGTLTFHHQFHNYFHMVDVSSDDYLF